MDSEIFSLDFDFLNVKNLESNCKYSGKPVSQVQVASLHHSTEKIEEIARQVNQKNELFIQIDKLTSENGILKEQLESLRNQLVDLQLSSEKVQNIINSEKHKAEHLNKQNLVLQEKLDEAEEKYKLRISSRDLLVAENLKLSGQVARVDSISLKYVQLVYSVFHKNFKSIRGPVIIKNIREVQEYIRGLSSEKRHSVNHILSWNPSEDVNKVLLQNKSSQTKTTQEFPQISLESNSQEIEYGKSQKLLQIFPEKNNQEIEYAHTENFEAHEPIIEICNKSPKKVDVGTMFPEVINYEKSFIKNILQEMSKSIDRITPIAELEPELLKRNRSTNTEFVNLKTNIDWISANVKQNQSRPPSRIGAIKTEKPITDNRSGVLKLWEILGQTIFELIQQGKNEFKENEVGFFNDRMQVMVDFLQSGKETQFDMTENYNISNEVHHSYLRPNNFSKLANMEPDLSLKSDCDSKRNMQSYKQVKGKQVDEKYKEQYLEKENEAQMATQSPLNGSNIIMNEFDGLDDETSTYLNNVKNPAKGCEVSVLYSNGSEQSKIRIQNSKQDFCYKVESPKPLTENNYFRINDGIENLKSIQSNECFQKPIPRWESEEELFAFDKESTLPFLENGKDNVQNSQNNSLQQEWLSQNEKEPFNKPLTKSNRLYESIKSLGKDNVDHSHYKRDDILSPENGVDELMKLFPLKCCDKLVSPGRKEDQSQDHEYLKSRLTKLFGEESDHNNSSPYINDSMPIDILERKIKSPRKKRRKKNNEICSPKKQKFETEMVSGEEINKFEFVPSIDTGDDNDSLRPQSPLYSEPITVCEPKSIPQTRTIHSVKKLYVDTMRDKVMNIKFTQKRNLKQSEIKFIIDLLNIYVNSPSSQQSLDDIFKKSIGLLESDAKAVFTGIVEVLRKTDECLDYNGHSNGPRLPLTIKKIVLYLQYAGKKIMNSISKFIEEFLFSTESHKHDLLICMNLTHLYIGLLDLKSVADHNSNARLYIAKCFYFYTDFAYPMIHQLILAFPGILPCNGDTTYDKSDALISTFQCILMNTYYANSSNQKLKMMKLFNLLTYRYKYQPLKPSKQDLIQNLISKIKAGKTKNVSLCFAIFCRRNDSNWNQKVIIEPLLLPLLTECYKALHTTDANDKSIACVLETISLLVKPMNITSDISNYLNIFSQFVGASVNKKCVQEAAVCAILRLSRFGYVNCYNVIKNLNPCKMELETKTKAALQTFLCTKKIKG
ncbi:hypothetical protein ACFFRR_009887 [Megaselia abdita]